ncbi:MAG TPA: DUF4974 domain-containing protein [Chitinophagaceae bacterium]|nr:DUF4974 domain-containing protein [Chitinophagaceae bacterium]
MKQPVKPKFSIHLLFIIVGLAASVVLVVATLLTENRPTPAETAPPVTGRVYFHYDPKKEPCDSIHPDRVVPHKAYSFKNANITTVLDTIRKWYGVPYAFELPVDNLFTGTIPKNTSLNDALRMLETMTPDPIRIMRLTPSQIIVNPICP